jgi:hypothetical protein
MARWWQELMKGQMSSDRIMLDRLRQYPIRELERSCAPSRKGLGLTWQRIVFDTASNRIWLIICKLLGLNLMKDFMEERQPPSQTVLQGDPASEIRFPLKKATCDPFTIHQRLALLDWTTASFPAVVFQQKSK